MSKRQNSNSGDKKIDEREPKKPDSESKNSEKKQKQGQKEKKEEKIASLEERIQKLKKELERREEELEKYYKALQRNKADFKNYKKRTEKERQNYIKNANQELVQSLLEVLDNFERALQSIPNEKKEDSIFQGIKMVKTQLYSILQKEGLEPIEIEVKEQEFDPHYHEAVERVETNEEEGTIIKEVQKGYLFNGKVLRPSKVKIAAPSKKSSTISNS